MFEYILYHHGKIRHMVMVTCLWPQIFMPRAIRQANTVITILGLTSTRSSGNAYTRAPIFLAMEMAYLAARNHSCRVSPRDLSRHC